MESIEKFFDVRNFDDFQIGHLMFVLNSPSYLDVFEPYLNGIRKTSNNLLLDPSQERKDRYNNDYLTGYVNCVDGLLALFKKLINETEMEKIARSQANLTSEQQYEIFRQGGKIKPISGLVREEEAPYDPSEDY